MTDSHSNKDEIKIYAHENLLMEGQRFDTFKTFKMPRLFRQYATYVPEPWHISDGGSNRLSLTGPYQMEYPPTDLLTFPSGQRSVFMNIAGNFFNAYCQYSKRALLIFEKDQQIVISVI